MRIFVSVIVVILCCILLSSCGFPIQSVSYKDPDFFDSEFRKICVSANVDDAFFMKSMEETVSAVLNNYGIYSIPASNILPPTRNWDDKKAQQILAEKGIDGYLVISIKDQYVVSNMIPGTKTIEKKSSTEGSESKPGETSKSRSSERGDTLTKKTKESTKEVTVIKETPARIETFDYAFLEAKIIDVATSKTAWIQNTRADENKGFLMKNIKTRQFLNDYGKVIIKDLAKDRLIRTNISEK